MREEIIRYRMRVLAVVALSMFLALTARLWYLQALKSDEAKDVATTNITRIINIEAPRGQIYDSSGKLLVGNRVVASVTINPKEIEESEMNPQERSESSTPTKESYAALSTFSVSFELGAGLGEVYPENCQRAGH